MAESSREIWNNFLKEREKGYQEFLMLRAQGREAEAKALDDYWNRRAEQAQRESDNARGRSGGGYP